MWCFATCMHCIMFNQDINYRLNNLSFFMVKTVKILSTSFFFWKKKPKQYIVIFCSYPTVAIEHQNCLLPV